MDNEMGNEFGFEAYKSTPGGELERMRGDEAQEIAQFAVRALAVDYAKANLTTLIGGVDVVLNQMHAAHAVGEFDLKVWWESQLLAIAFSLRQVLTGLKPMLVRCAETKNKKVMPVESLEHLAHMLGQLPPDIFAMILETKERMELQEVTPATQHAVLDALQLAHDVIESASREVSNVRAAAEK